MTAVYNGIITTCYKVTATLAYIATSIGVGTYLRGTAQAVPLFKVGRLSRPTFLGENVHAFRNFCRKSMGKPIFFARD